MKSVFFFLMLLMIVGINSYVAYRLVCMLPKIMFLRWAVVVMIIAAVFCFVGNFLLEDKLSVGVLSWMYKVGSSWFFASVYLLLAFLVLDILRITHLLPVAGILYKSWLGFGGVVGLVAVVLLWGNIKYNKKERVELNIALNKGNEAASSLKIVALSDIHLGYSIGNKEFARWIELINQEKPDVVLIAGDMIDNSLRPVREQQMEKLFKTIQTKYGIYASPGNHEYISNIAESEAFLKDAGVHLLKDRTVLIDNRFYIIGRDDRINPERESLKSLVDTLDPLKPIIVLDHQPYELEKVEESKVDLQISGHTHRGQIWPVSWITDAIYETSHGYLKKGDSHIYVSSGIGLWGGKFRVGTQSEYVVINLKVN